MGRIAMAPSAAAFPLSEAKALLRIETSGEDALLAGQLRAAAEACEAFTGRLLLAREVSETVPAGAAWTRLGAAPVRAITTIAALAPDGTETALAPGDYAIDVDAAGEGWVRAGPSGASRLRVGYTAGLAEDWNGVPEPLRQGIVRLAAHLHAHREGGAGPPAAITALWRPWRRLRLR